MSSASKKCYYGILGVSPRATNKQITAAYRKLALKFHPDRVTTGGEAAKAAATSQFTEISEAYRTLNDERTRWEYDNIHGIGLTNGGHHHEVLSKVENFFALHRGRQTRQQQDFETQRKPFFSFSINISNTTMEPNGVRKTVSKSSKFFNGNHGSRTETAYYYPDGRTEVKIEQNSSQEVRPEISTKHLQGSSMFCSHIFTGVQEKVTSCFKGCRDVADPLLCGSMPCLAAAK